MEKFLAVQVEHSQYVSLFSLERARESSLSLTTLVDNQKRADVQIFLVQDGKKTLIQSFIIDKLPRGKAGEPRIILKSSFNGRFRLQFKIILNGRLRDSGSVSLRKYLKKHRFSPLLLVLLLLLLLSGAISLLLLPGRCTSSSPDPAENQYDSPGVASRSTDGQPATDVPGNKGAEPQSPAVAPKQEGVERKQPTPEAPFFMEERVYFGPDNAELTPEAQSQLRETAKKLIEHPDERIHIYGHCALYGTERGRITLSKQRALEVAEFLRSRGWDPDQEPVIHAMGGNRPVTKDKEKQHLNRRVEILVTPPDSNSTSRQDR